MRGAPPPDVFDEPFLGKSTVQVALVMALIVILGVLGVGGMLKLHGYGSPHLSDVPGLRWNSWAVFVRHHGFHLLWAPLIWTLFAVIAQRRDRGSLYPATFWIGVAVTVFLIVAFFYAVTPVFRFEITTEILKAAGFNVQTPS